MQDAVNALQASLDAVKPQLDRLADVKGEIASAENKLEAIETQIQIRGKALDELHSQIDSAKAVANKIQKDEIERRQDELRRLVGAIDIAKKDLADLQTKTHNEHSRWQGLMKKTNKLEAALG
jgi:chromosome segregation ATPase